MSSYLLAEAELFNGHSGVWLDSETGTWVHRGHASEDTVNAYLATAFVDLDELQAIPGTLQHQWLRVTAHGTGSDDDADLRWETTAPGTEGALQVTVVTAGSVDEDGDL